MAVLFTHVQEMGQNLAQRNYDAESCIWLPEQKKTTHLFCIWQM